MNTATCRSISRLRPSTRHLAVRPPPSRYTSTTTYTPPPSASSAPPRREPLLRPRPSDKPQTNHKQRSTIVPDTIAPQLSQAEIVSVFSQELFVFRCDVTATQIPAAMLSYKQLSEAGVLTPNDISNLARQLHARYRMDKIKEDILPHVKTLIEDFKANKIPGHPLASVHLLSCLKDMEEFACSDEFWAWLVQQDENYCDARTYGSAIECLSYQGVSLNVMEALWEDALDRYSTTTVPSVAMNTGRGVPVMLLQGIITARLFHGNWRAAYEAFDICTRLYPTLTPPRIYELFIYERPVREAYIIFLMACRAGTPPKPGVLTPVLKEVWLKTHDVRAMIRLVYSFVGAGGRPNAIHLNSLIGGILGSFPLEMTKDNPEYETLFKGTLGVVRSLILAFNQMGVPLSPASFNTIISVGGKLKRQELVHSGFQELLAAGLKPNMVTYRALVNAVGDMKDETLLEQSWNMLKKGRQELQQKWDMMDWKALIRACVATGREDFLHKELEENKERLGSMFVHNIKGVLHRATLPAAKKPQEEANPKPPTKQQLEKEVRALTEVFSSGQIQDFSARDSEALFDISPSDGNPEGVTLSPEQEAELRTIYDKLTIPTKVIDAQDQTTGGTKSITGYSADALRWENWKAVNRLLFEAECYDMEQERRKIKATQDASGDTVVVENKDKKEKNVGYEFMFWNEDQAKARIKAEIEDVVHGRRTGKEGWRKQEMNVRGRLVNRKWNN
ncbi:hypothetical protein K440DRAFT_576998 [Wilcoxina mikolae CBS 423.85]|nr:hypothetical protein K440DRAFT_576998 [Wilcoxina mikolae CBS 423.85]